MQDENVLLYLQNSDMAKDFFFFLFKHLDIKLLLARDVNV